MYCIQKKHTKRNHPSNQREELIVGDIVARKILFLNQQRRRETDFFTKSNVMLNHPSNIIIESGFYEERHPCDKSKMLTRKFTLLFYNHEKCVCTKSAHAFIIFLEHDKILLIDNSYTGSVAQGRAECYTIQRDTGKLIRKEQDFSTERDLAVLQCEQHFEHVPTLRTILRRHRFV